MLTSNKKRMKTLPTSSSSTSEGFFLILVQMSMVKMVEAELKTEVREDMRAAIITASISPRSPVGMRSRTRRMKAMFVQPPFDSQICSHL